MVVIYAINEPETFVPLTFALETSVQPLLIPHGKNKSQMRSLICFSLTEMSFIEVYF